MDWDEREIAALLVRAVLQSEVEAAECPHVVVCTTGFGAEWISGPFESGLAALAAAEDWLHAAELENGDTLDVRVAPLVPPAGE